MDGSIEMDNSILIIRIFAWPFIVLLLGALFMFLFRKPIVNRLKQLKIIDAKKGVLRFGESPIDISVQQDLTATKVEPMPTKSKDAITWNKSGALYWLGYDLMWTIDAILRGGSKDIIIHGLKQSLLNLQEIGLTGSYMELSLKTMIHDTKNSHEKDWTQVRRNWAAIKLTSIKYSIGKLAIENQPGFKYRPDD